jgi:hypothetical protein
MSAPNPFSTSEGEKQLEQGWGIPRAHFEKLKKIVGETTYQDLVLNRLRQDKQDDLYVILSRLAERPPGGESAVVPNDRPVLLPMMDLLTRILAVDNYLEKLLAAKAFDGQSSAQSRNPGRNRLDESDAILKCLGIRDFTRVVEWITISGNKPVDGVDLRAAIDVLRPLSTGSNVGQLDQIKAKLSDAAKKLERKNDLKYLSLIDSKSSRTKSVIDVANQLIFCYQNLDAANQPIPTFISSLASVIYRDSRYKVPASDKRQHPWVGFALDFLRNEENGEYSQYAELVDLGISTLMQKNPAPIALSSDIWLLGSLYERVNGAQQLTPNDDPYEKILQAAKKKQIEKGRFLLRLTLSEKSQTCTVDIVSCSEGAKKTKPVSGQLVMFVYPIKFEERHPKHNYVITVQSQGRGTEDKTDDPLMAGDLIVIDNDESKKFVFYGFDATGRVIAIDTDGKVPALAFLEPKKAITKIAEHDAEKDPALPLDGLNKAIRSKRKVDYTAGQLPTSVAYELQNLVNGRVKGKNVQDYVASTQGKGFRSYIVGGGVRDTLLYRDVNDVDLATLMPAVEVYHKLLKERLTRKKSPFDGSSSKDIPPIKKKIVMGIVKVDPDNPKGIDIVTFHDGMNKPGSSIVSGSGFIYDALSRDFTFNAIYYDSTDRKLIDATGCGLEDLGYQYRQSEKNLYLEGIRSDGKTKVPYEQHPAHIEIKLRFVCCALSQIWENSPVKDSDALRRHLTNFPVDMARWIKFLSKNNPRRRLRYIPYNVADLSDVEHCLKKLADKNDEKVKERFTARMGCTTTAALAVFDNPENFISVVNRNARLKLVDGKLLKSIKGSLERIFHLPRSR